MNEHDMNLATSAGAHLVPAGFAEKAMASLMQLHHELVAEKEKRVQLYRTLMQKEQSLAELAMYVRVLEERLAQSGSVTTGDTAAPVLGAPVAAPDSAVAFAAPLSESVISGHVGVSVRTAPPRDAPAVSPAVRQPASTATPRAPVRSGVAAQPPRRATEGWRTW